MAKQNDKVKIISMIIIFLFIIEICILNSVHIISSVKAASTWTQTSETDFGTGTANNVIVVGSENNAEIRLNYTELNNWSLISPNTNPGDREHHTMTSIYGTDKVLFFGGHYGTYKNETWVFDLSENNWINMDPPGNKPTGRAGHAMASISGDDKVVLFGGYDGGTSYDDKTWVYDLSENAWTLKTPKNSPSSRTNHAMASIYGTDKVLLFAGYSDLGTHDDTWVYDLSEDDWSEKKSLIIKPNGREAHPLTSIYGTDKVLLFGGYTNGIGDLNDTWIYDLSDNTWVKKTPPNNPSARSEHEITSICGTDKVILFGGTKGGNETWIYDLSEADWQLKTPKDGPSSRYFHAVAPVYSTGVVVLFGGVVDSDETWLYKYYEYASTGTYVSSPYFINTSVSLSNLSWNCLITSNTSIKFQLRSALEESALISEDFVGPDGSTLTYYTVPSTNIWHDHEGDKWIQYKMFLSTINNDESPILNNVSIGYNHWPDTILVSPAIGEMLSNNKPIFIWNFTDLDSPEQLAYQVQIADDNEFGSVSYDSGVQNSATQRWEFPSGTSYTELPDGSWYWRVRTKDSDGAWGVFSDPCEIVIDSTVPRSIPLIPSNNGQYNSMNMISGRATDGEIGSGINKVEITISKMFHFIM